MLNSYCKTNEIFLHTIKKTRKQHFHQCYQHFDYQENNHRANLKRSKYGNHKNTQVSGVQYKVDIFWYVFVFFRYIPWNFHQMEENEFNFEGDRNFVSFINQAQDVGLFVILRAGPYICGEWDFVSINDKGTLLY